MLRGDLKRARAKFAAAFRREPDNPTVINNLHLLDLSSRYIVRAPDAAPSNNRANLPLSSGSSKPGRYLAALYSAPLGTINLPPVPSSTVSASPFALSRPQSGKIAPIEFGPSDGRGSAPKRLCRDQRGLKPKENAELTSPARHGAGQTEPALSRWN